MVLSAILINSKDNVATALRLLKKGEKISFSEGSRTVEVVLSEDIPCGHKLALEDIEIGAPIIKYGETIGLATHNISPGEHVHIHNVEGTKGRGDKI